MSRRRRRHHVRPPLVSWQPVRPAGSRRAEVIAARTLFTLEREAFSALMAAKRDLIAKGAPDATTRRLEAQWLEAVERHGAAEDAFLAETPMH